VSQDIYFAFSQPKAALLVYGYILLGLAVPVWKIRKVRSESGSVLAFLWSSKGWPYLTIIILGLFGLSLLVGATYSGFWTLQIVDADRAELGYWFPRSDGIVSPHDVAEIKLVTNYYYSKGEVVNQNWTICLATRAGTEYKSVDIHDESKLDRAITALEQWTGLRHRRYSRHGLFGSIQPEAP
jgi:hypothetical protein